MIKSKIDVDKVHELPWKAYVKLLEKDLKQAQDKGVKQLPVVLISDFEFACGETHTLLVFGKKPKMVQYYKKLKKERNQLKDFSIGMAAFEVLENGQFSFKIGVTGGLGKPTKMKKNSKKLIKKLGVNLVDIVKGDLLESVIETIDNENENASEKYQKIDENLQSEAEHLKQVDDTANDDQAIRAVAKSFVKQNKALNLQVIPMLKQAATDNSVEYTAEQVDLAEAAFRAAASLVDKCEEMGDTKIPADITKLQLQVVEKKLVTKYEKIWKKIKKAYAEQNGTIDELLKSKFMSLEAVLQKLEATIK